MLPTQINAGQSSIDKSGKYNIQVKIKLDDLTQENSRDYESFAAGASFVPLVMVIFFAATTRMVCCICASYDIFCALTLLHPSTYDISKCLHPVSCLLTAI